MDARPPIVMTETDQLRLQEYIRAAHDPRTEQAVASLDDEIARAQIVAARDAPPGLVTMNSKVVFEDVLTLRRREITLVYPEDADAASGRVSVFAPVGAALLGLSVGQEIDWPLPNGKVARFRVAEVLYQPEAAGDYHL